MGHEKIRTLGTYIVIVAVLGGVLAGSAYFMGVDLGTDTLFQENCAEERKGIYTTEVRVSSIDVTDQGLETEIIHMESSPVTVKSISITESGNEVASSNRTTTVPVSGSRTYTFENLRAADSCKTLNMEIIYDYGSITDLKASGELKAAVQTG